MTASGPALSDAPEIQDENMQPRLIHA